MRPTLVLLAATVAATPALAQRSIALPTGHNLRDRPEQPGDVVLDVSGSGAYSLNGQPIAASQIARRLMSLLLRTRDHVVYIRADAQLPASALDSASALAARGFACVASFVGTQEPGTRSLLRGDAGPEAGNVRRAIDMQLALPRIPPATLAELEASAIVLQVLPGPTYRINTRDVPAADLTRALRQIFDPRPIKILFVRADPAVSYQDVFRAMDVARISGVFELAQAPAEMTIRSTLPTIDLSVKVTERDDGAAERIEGNIGRCRRGDVYLAQSASARDRMTGPDRVFFEFQVEQRATPLPNAVAPHYPDMIRASGTSGEVLAQFVVDTNGVVEPGTFKVLKSTHDLFTQAVKDVLPKLRFMPATIAGKPVRQLVQMPFSFSVER